MIVDVNPFVYSHPLGPGEIIDRDRETAELLANEVLANAAKWNFVNLAPKFATRPLLVITSDDGLTAPNDGFVDAAKKSGNREVNTVHIPTDHSYSDHRIALQQTVLDWLARLTRK